MDIFCMYSSRCTLTQCPQHFSTFKLCSLSMSTHKRCVRVWFMLGVGPCKFVEARAKIQRIVVNDAKLTDVRGLQCSKPCHTFIHVIASVAISCDC